MGSSSVIGITASSLLYPFRNTSGVGLRYSDHTIVYDIDTATCS